MTESNNILDIELPVFLEKEFDDRHVKYRSKVLGWSDGNFVMLALPSINGAILRWDPGTPCIVKFINKGSVYAFQSVMVKIIFQPYPLMFLKYPAEIENITIRQHERIQTYLICDMYRDGAVIVMDDDAEQTDYRQNVVLLDLSPGGGLVEVIKETPGVSEPGSSVLIDFILPNGIKIVRLKAEIKNVRIDSGKRLLGIKFSDMDSPQIMLINEFFNKYLKKS